MTIEEIALKAYPPMPDPRSDIDDGWDYNEQYRDCYINGAKTVLKEIEFAMSLSSGSEHVALEAIKQSIKNLKGGEK